MSFENKTTAGDSDVLRPVLGSEDGRGGTASIVEGSGEPRPDHRVEIGDPQNGIDRKDGGPPDSEGDLEGIDQDVDQDVDSKDVDQAAVVLGVSPTSREEVVEGAKKKKRKQ